jgi:hypothetical protein
MVNSIMIDVCMKILSISGILKNGCGQFMPANLIFVSTYHNIIWDQLGYSVNQGRFQP